MTWGSYGIVHFASLAAAAIMLVGLYFLLKRFSQRVQLAVLGVLSFAGVGAIIYNLVNWGAPLEYLPLHLCSINAILLPIVVFTRSKVFGNLLLVWCLGALAALVMNQQMTEAVLFDWPFNFFYFPHVLEFGIPLILFKLGLIKKDYRCIGSTLVLTMVIYTLIHFANVLINSYCMANGISYNGTDIVQVNYMFSITPTNPLLVLFYQVIPCEYWYMYMVVPIVAVYLLIVYAPQIIGDLRKRKQIKV